MNTLRSMTFIASIVFLTVPLLIRAQSFEYLELNQNITNDSRTTNDSNIRTEPNQIPTAAGIMTGEVFVKVTTPNGGEVTALNPNVLEKVTFDYGGPLEKTSGNYSFRIELWRNEKLLGPTHNLKYQINPYQTSVNSYGHKPGEYIATKNNGDTYAKVAEIGTGYKFRVILSESITPPGEATYLKELASDFSDASFSYVEPEPTISIGMQAFEPIFAKITAPNGDEKISINDKTLDVNFNYGGSFDKSKDGSYYFRVELWRNGALLGNISNFNQYSLKINESSVSFGTLPGKYWVPDPSKGKEMKKAEVGTGYKYRAVLLLASTPPGEPTQFTEIAEDFSDSSFSLVKPQSLLRTFGTTIKDAVTKPIWSFWNWLKNLF